MDYKRFVVAVVTLLHLHFGLTDGWGVIKIHFLSYADDCDEIGGLDKCDPMFTFCVTTPDGPESFSRVKCKYKTTSESGHFHDTDYINFSNMDIIKGLKNPWVIIFQELMGDTIKLVWRVVDDEPAIVGSEHLVTHSILLTERVWPNEGVAKYATRKSQKSDHILRFNITIYCTSDTYGPQCSVYCPPPAPGDKYYCDPHTGDKLCIDGWTGENCTTNIDECYEGICVHGECTDLMGSYKCENCDEGYTGKNCDTPLDPCRNNPCQDRGDCIRSNIDPTQYSCDCFYPYTGVSCEDESPTTTRTTSTTSTSTTTTTSSSTTTMAPTPDPDTVSPVSPVDDISHDEGTTDPLTTDTTEEPVAKASKAESAGFDGWIILVICLCIIIAVAFFLICFVCRRKKIVQRRKESRIPLPSSATYDGESLAFDNVAYNDMNQREELPPLPTAPRLSQLSPSFHPEKDVKNGHEEMDDDGYLKANAISTFARDTTDGLTASGRRAQSNLYSNFENLGGAAAASNADYDDEQHYHDLDEAAMSVRRNNNNNNSAYDDVDDPQPISPEEEGAYSDLPRNTPSYKNRHSNNYDELHPRPDSRDLPKIPDAKADTRPGPKPSSSKTKDKGRQRFYPEMVNEPLKTSDPFASQVMDDDYDGPEIDLPTRNGVQYETPRSSQKGGRFAGEGEGGYELPNADVFGGASKRSNESGGYEVPDQPPSEYANPSILCKKQPPVPKKPDSLKTSNFYVSATTPPTYNNENGHALGEEEEEELSFPPPPPPLNPEDLEDIETRTQQSAARPLSFHHGQSEMEGADKYENVTKKRHLENDGFLNPLFGGEGPSEPAPSSSTDGAIDVRDSAKDYGQGNRDSRPLSFHYGQTEKDREDDDKEDSDSDAKDDDDVSRRRLENTGFVNPNFDDDTPRGFENDQTRQIDERRDNQTDEARNDDVSLEHDNVSPHDAVPKPGVVPLYMENFGFDDLDL